MMKKNIKKYIIGFLAIFVCLMMVSTATAVPAANNANLKEEGEENFLKNFVEKILNKVANTDSVEEIESLVDTLTEKEYMPNSLLEDIFWAIVVLLFRIFIFFTWPILLPIVAIAMVIIIIWMGLTGNLPPLPPF